MVSELLIAEDEEGFRLIEKLAITRSQLDVPFHFCTNGVEVQDFLNKRIEEKAELPSTLLLDINMPLMNGWEVCDWMKDKEELSSITTIIVSSSDNLDDINRAKSMNIEYKTKPLQFEDYVAFFNKIKESN